MRHVLVATYFDTEDLRLTAQKITLRRRTGGEDEGWHLKVPAGPDAKKELRVPLGESHEVPGRLAGLVAAHVRGVELKEVATLATTRTVVKLLDAKGVMLAEIADDLVTGQNVGSAESVSWRELEVELGEGSRELLRSVGDRLMAAGAVPSTSSSKVGRVLPTPEQGRPVFDKTSAGDAVVRYLGSQVDQLLLWDPKVRLAEFDAVHKMRVAVRRIRSVLKSYRRVLRREATDPLQPELKWLADVLGEVRDLEVLRERFNGRVQSLPATLTRPAEPSWLAALAVQEEEAYARVNAELIGSRYFALLDALDGLLNDPPLTKRARKDAVTEVPKLVRKSWNRMVEAHATVDQLTEQKASGREIDLAQHETRKAAKRARYTADAAVDVLGKPAKQVSKAAKCLQEILGRHQDGVIAQERLLSLAAQHPDEGFVLGVLYGIERCEADAALTGIEEAWAAATDPAGLELIAS
jgi:CHAD domain-containing protein